MTEKKTVLSDKLHWYKDAVIYELHIKAFHDSNGDGIGDFQGLMEKLDYLEDLGVTAIWVLPFYPSPLRDDGYDIADYYSINPSYGHVDDFHKFLKEAHRRNLKVITELVINHTSDQHPWFQRARHAEKDSPERNYYVWTDDPKKYRDARIIFQDYEASNWTWDPVAKQYFWHRFFHHQPDLNFDNPEVQQEVFDVLDYWCKMGVDGFRLDAVPYLFERDGTNCENLPETHVFLKKLRTHVDKKYPGTLLLAEANMWPEDSAAYFGDGDECQMNYHFPVMPRMFMALRMEDKYPITDIFDQTPEIPETCQWAIFLRNHDELTLEMVTDEERDYMYKVYAKDPKARINLGIRHRLSPLMENNRRQIELMNHLLFSLPGTPVIYYGDEIGMGDNFYLGDRDGVRTPMQWSPDRNAGFSKANPQKLYLPVILDPEYSYESVNVETQRHNTSSLLWWMKRMIHMRKRHKAFGRGDLQFIQVENAKVLVFSRTYEDENILVVANLSRFSQSAHLKLDDFGGYIPLEIFSKNKFPEIKEGEPYFFTLSPYAYHWFHLQKAHKDVEEHSSTPELEVADWTDVVKAGSKTSFEENGLYPYLMKTRWFSGKAKTIQNVQITDFTEVESEHALFFNLLIEVSYETGMPDLYQMPLAYAPIAEGEQIIENFPKSFICRINTDSGKGILYDALYNQHFQNFLLKGFIKSEKENLKTGNIRFEGLKDFHPGHKKYAVLKPRILSANHNNTILAYDNHFILKYFRKLEKSENPDLQMNRYFFENGGFSKVPKLLGSVEWNIGSDTVVVAMVQEYVQNQGNAWSYMLENLRSYNDRILELNHKDLPKFEILGDLVNPVSFDKLPSAIQEIIGMPMAERARLLGVRTAEMHLTLSQELKNPGFIPEEFSLHYQRSLFSSLQSLVRGAYQSLDKQLEYLPENIRKEADKVFSLRSEILDVLKRIYKNKFEAVKIRNHGDFHLEQVLFTGKDFVITDFEGESSRSFSERRLKRSPLRDVAGMIRSFHYVAYSGLVGNNQHSDDEIKLLQPWAEHWFHYMSGFFIKAYLEKVQGSNFIPTVEEDLTAMLETFILEKAIYELNYELNNRPDWVLIPILGIQSIMRKYSRQ